MGDQGSQNDNIKTEEENEEENKTARNSKLSDMDYLRSKVVSSSRKPHKKKKSRKGRDSDTDSNNGESSDEGSVDVDTKESDNDDDDDDNDDDDDDDNDDEDDDDDDGNDVNDDDDDGDDINDGDKGENSKESIKFGTIKMRGLPFKVKEKHIKDFFAPLRLLDIRMIENKEGKPTGCAFVDFGSENDIKEALKRDRDCIQGRYIELFRDKEKHSNQIVVKEKPWMTKLAGKEGEEEFESIAEVCRITCILYSQTLLIMTLRGPQKVSVLMGCQLILRRLNIEEM